MQSWNRGEVTELRYAVEVEIPNATRMVGLLEPLLEQVVYEDIPTNLRAIKLRVEKLKAEGNTISKIFGSPSFQKAYLVSNWHAQVRKGDLRNGQLEMAQ